MGFPWQLRFWRVMDSLHPLATKNYGIHISLKLMGSPKMTRLLEEELHGRRSPFRHRKIFVLGNGVRSLSSMNIKENISQPTYIMGMMWSLLQIPEGIFMRLGSASASWEADWDPNKQSLMAGSPKEHDKTHHGFYRVNKGEMCGDD